MKVFFYKRALKQAEKIRRKDKQAWRRIQADIDALANYPDTRTLWIKKLKGEYTDCFCLKTRGFRIVFTLEESGEIHVVDIRDRKDAYK